MSIARFPLFKIQLLPSYGHFDLLNFTGYQIIAQHLHRDIRAGLTSEEIDDILQITPEQINLLCPTF